MTNFELSKAAKDKMTGMNMQFDFKGLGVSFIDNQPKELIYLCINDLALAYNYLVVNDHKKDSGGSSTLTRTFLKFQVGNLQIDNLINDEMPVVIGPKNFYNSSLKKASVADMNSNLSEFYKIVKDKDLERIKRRKGKKK